MDQTKVVEMNRSRTILALTGVMALAACQRAPETYAASCATPLSHWGTEKNGIGHLVPLWSVYLTNDGTVLWNKAAISDDALRSYMMNASDLKPRPQVILQVGPAASCERVKKVRSIMDSAPMCRDKTRYCSEGWKPDQWPMSGGP